MAEETLITALEDDAREQARQILEEARQTAESILREASLEAEQERQERTDALKQRLRSDKAAVLNGARMKASGSKLAIRHELADRAVNDAQERFASLPKEEYSGFLGQLFSELKSEWDIERPGEVPVVLVNQADMGLLKTDLKVREDNGVRLGVVFVSGDGKIRFENTVAARLSKGRTVMAPAINEMLFDEVL